MSDKGDELSNKEVVRMVRVFHLRLGELLKSTLESMDPRVMVEWLDDHCFDHVPKTHRPSLAKFEPNGILFLWLS